MRKNQKGFLIVLCLCMLSVSGIYGVYQYRRAALDPEQAAPDQTARAEESGEAQTEKETANSEGTVAQADTEEKGTDEAKIETEEDIYEIGEASLAQSGASGEVAVGEEGSSGELAENGDGLSGEVAENGDGLSNGTAGEAGALPGETGETEAEAGVGTVRDSAVAASGTEIQAGLFSFSEGDSLMWPVDGDVVLNYSMDKGIYFSTLNQYKYHPAIVISAAVGSEVLCAARGEVSQITVNEETGTTMTMDLGNGYEAVYGQLKEVSVAEGQTVEQGALLGYVSEPTKYYTLEGSNLYFQLLKDGEPVNPMDYIE